MSSSQIELNFYRFTSIGVSLLDSLDELVGEGKIPPQLAMKVMEKFDKIAAGKVPLVDKKALIRGHVDFYRGADEVWQFVLDDAQLWMEDEGRPSKTRKADATSSRLKIVAIKSSAAVEGEQQTRR
ncbi:hypothetical protein AURDEDRAFT_165333 [Auricularia subglabra TFB-10046 SS5]|nr:hypothetical protein AURDEDRAFT_165333 [Auricularia subglabra TFB-10046 SS5]